MYTELLPVVTLPMGKGYGCVCMWFGINAFPCRPYCRKAASRRSVEEGPHVGGWPTGQRKVLGSGCTSSLVSVARARLLEGGVSAGACVCYD